MTIDEQHEFHFAHDDDMEDCDGSQHRAVTPLGLDPFCTLSSPGRLIIACQVRSRRLGQPGTNRIVAQAVEHGPGVRPGVLLDGETRARSHEPSSPLAAKKQP